MTLRLLRFLAAASCLLAAACGDDETRTLTLDIVTGHETTALRDDPPVVDVQIVATDTTGAAVATASAPPGGTFDFGDLATDVPLTFDLTGTDATGAPVVRGRSLSGIVLGQIQSDALPLFVQRLGAWSRPPDTLPSTRLGAVAVSIAERYLALTGGAFEGDDDPDSSLAYDLLGWYGDRAVPLPRVPRSAISRGTAMLAIDDSGATRIDFASGVVTEISPPEGLTFADVAGGVPLEAADGRTFLVGATRPEAPTTAVLVVDADGSLRAASLAAPRVAAAAVWLDGVGLVIAGGNATAPGVEVLAAEATTATSRPFPPDPTAGAGAVVGGLGDVVLIGGLLPGGTPAPTRRLAPACATDCAPAPLDTALLPAPLADVRAYAFPAGRALALGTDATPDAGAHTRSFLLDLITGAASELPLREPRAGASVIPAPNGTLALLGGVLDDGSPALTLEMLFPE
ncbi:hypothetical protein [Chondromyces apiculatus]|uniref:Lipoprotein n=1 Tax=Chondromyces apiculatus DSM 436 TaxID=1192034 RepID=A0A017T1N5_9BACT|nr:hypothetical protein [Chondromyces apiculatus]EYF02461.1 Hypothetical protein CAP_7083 [Chondromyces apiculatus DSM 436]